MINTDTREKLASRLETLVSHVNDSIKGFDKAAEKLEDEHAAVKQVFLAVSVSREAHAKALNERLECIGEEEELDGSIRGAAHRGLIALKDLFRSSGDPETIIDETIRGEEKLLEYIRDTFADLDVIDGASSTAIVELRANVQSTIAELNKHKN